MTVSNPLTAALQEVEATRAKISALRRANPDQWKTDFGRLRPVLDDKIARLSREGDIWLSVHGKDGQREEFARLVTAARDALLHHQACWPILVIKSESSEYLASVKTVEAKFAELTDFVKRLPR